MGEHKLSEADKAKIIAKVEKLMHAQLESPRQIPVGNVHLDGGGWVLIRYESP